MSERLTPDEYEAKYPSTDCLLWDGALTQDGYGAVYPKARGKWKSRRRVHRVVWVEANGPIPEGMTIDHLCRSRNCINIDHLEVVTKKENTLRGNSPAAQHARKTHCIYGHEYTPENTYTNRGKRNCKACRRTRDRERWRSRNGYYDRHGSGP